MEQSPSWEANSLSASQEILCILWIPQVHYCVHNSLLNLRNCVTFCNKLSFYIEEMLAPCPTPKLEDHSSQIQCWFFRISYKWNLSVTVNSQFSTRATVPMSLVNAEIHLTKLLIDTHLTTVPINIWAQIFMNTVHEI
jgi:hypothetical protein